MGIFAIILLVALWGVFKPFKGIKRKYFAIAAVVSFLMVGISAPPTKPSEPSKPVDPAVAAAEKEAATKAEATRVAESIMENQRSNAGRQARTAIKNAARNPDSVSFEAVMTNESGSLICVVYRAQNGFGGMNLEQVAFKNGVPKQGSSFWNKNCAGAKLYSQSTSANWL